MKLFLGEMSLFQHVCFPSHCQYACILNLERKGSSYWQVYSWSASIIDSVKELWLTLHLWKPAHLRMPNLAKSSSHLFSDNSLLLLFSRITMATVGSHEAVLAGNRLQGELVWKGSGRMYFHFHRRRHDFVAAQQPGYAEKYFSCFSSTPHPPKYHSITLVG